MFCDLFSAPFLDFICMHPSSVIKDTHRKKNTLKLNSGAFKKYENGHLGHWYIKLTLLLGSKTGTNFPKK